VISGDEDRSPAAAQVLAASAPNGEFHLVRGAGHYVNLERPSATARILRQVVDEVTSGP
jgi:pimeloyl-ACP methyl ester carboxylesterase